MSLAPVLARIDADIENATQRLLELLRIPSISTDPAFDMACETAADWLVDQLRAIGAEAQKHQTPGKPMVMGSFTGSSNPDAPHILFYGHYDVQPADPLELWHHHPFEPAVEQTAQGRVIRGRGSSDDKGQLMTFVEACRAWKNEHGQMPCKISFFFEGEEESGSPSLVPFMKTHKKALKADVVLICDTGLFDDRVPAIVTMLRGMVSEDVVLRAANRDLHSGLYGGMARNPLHVLSQILASLHDETGRVQLPGFYDGVRDIPPHLSAQWQSLNFSHQSFLGEVGLRLPAGETAYSPLEHVWARPTCEINGVCGGYTGDGFKTVLPSQASAKISCRLVEGQDPEKIRAALHAHVSSHLPADCTVEFNSFGASPAVVMPSEAPQFEIARAALSAEWEQEAAFTGGGGSIPVAGHFQDIIGVSPMLIGFAKDNDQIHSPNEKYDLQSFHKGIRSWARIIEALSIDKRSREMAKK